MLVKRLDLRNYRNYETACADFSPARNFITGPNGSGKTNVLEAIYYLSQTRSFKKAEDRELIRTGADFAALSLNFSGEDEDDHQLNAVIEAKGRTFLIDEEKKRSASEVLGHLLTVAYEPQMVFLFKEDPQSRRRLFDETLSAIDAQYLYALGRYKRYLKERNAALSLGYDKDILQVLTLELIQSSYRVHLLRQRFVERIDGAVAARFKALDNSEREVRLSYRSNTSRALGYEEYLADMRKIFEEHQSEEATRKLTLIGVHRDDLTATIDGLDLSASGSQGQNRLVTLAVKLAVAELIASITEHYPVLLLDDVASDLDRLHLEQLIAALDQYPGQVFVTGAQPLQQLVGWAQYHVNNNQIDRRS